jgi:uncharacterized protein YecE (DUF72 family)
VLPLFDPPPSFDKTALAARLRELAREGVFIGTSSWKYEGWIGQIYNRDRYLVRGRFSQKRFASECLAEYAETFPVVCGDFSFYQFPSEEYWRRLFSSAPASLQVALKVPEEVTVRHWPKHARYGPKAGLDNETFLNAGILETMFLQPLREFQPRVAALILEFGTFSQRDYANAGRFLLDLERFLDHLPGDFRYAVEIRNREFLRPEYFDCLRSRGVAHVFNAWTRMPPLVEQMTMPGAFTTNFFVTRGLLRAGRSYEEAVRVFTPYDKVRDENPETRDVLREMIRRAREERRTAYIFVNNRLEGNGPETIRAVVGE